MKVKVLDIEKTLEDLEFAPPCGRHVKLVNEGWKAHCDKPAEWIGIFACCGHTFLLCDLHMKTCAAGAIWTCLGCGRDGVKVHDMRRL